MEKDDDTTIPNGTFTITSEMSKASRERAEKEALENGQKVVAGINEETSKPEHDAPE